MALSRGEWERDPPFCAKNIINSSSVMFTQKSFRFKVSPTCIPYICAVGFITDTRNSVHLTGNTFTKKQFLFAFTNEVNIMYLSLESPQPPSRENMGHGWGFVGALTLCPSQGHSRGGGGISTLWPLRCLMGLGLGYFSLLPCPSREE